MGRREKRTLVIIYIYIYIYIHKILEEGRVRENEEDMIQNCGGGFEGDGDQSLEKESTGHKWIGNNINEDDYYDVTL